MAIVERPKRVAGDLKRAIKKETDASAKQAGVDSLNRLRKRRATMWGGVGVAAIATVDAAYFGTALGALHLAFLPGALAVDAALAIGGAGIALGGAYAAHREKKRIREASSLKSLENKRRITGTKGNRRGIRYGVIDGTAYRTPVKTTDGGITTVKGSTSIDGLLVRFNTEAAGGLLTASKVGGYYHLDGAPFGGHRVKPETYLASGTTRTAQTLQFIKDRAVSFGLKDKIDKRAFVSKWGSLRPLNPAKQRAIVGFTETERATDGSQYILRVKGRKATIHKTGPNFAKDPTDLVKYKGWRWWRKDKDGNYIHSRIRIRSPFGNPDKIRRLAMRAIVQGGNIRFKREGSPVFNRYIGWWKNSAGNLNAYIGEEAGLADTPGIKETHARRQALIDQQARAAAATRAESAAAAEAARIKWPEGLGEQQGWVTYAESLFGSLGRIEHTQRYRSGEKGSAVALEPMIRPFGNNRIEFRQVELQDGVSSGSTVVRTSQTLDTDNHVLGFTIDLFDRKVPGSTRAEDESLMMSLRYDPSKRIAVETTDNRTREAAEGQTVESAIQEWTRIGQTLFEVKPQQAPATA